MTRFRRRVPTTERFRRLLELDRERDAKAAARGSRLERAFAAFLDRVPDFRHPAFARFLQDGVLQGRSSYRFPHVPRVYAAASRVRGGLLRKRLPESGSRWFLMAYQDWARHNADWESPVAGDWKRR